ncbi:intermembrane transport protein PqiB [Benzoatithermus flavus]|uniref:MlaD family protein n=1 Tax=Benzoatithermus flavus TaxID=3108223 RepID=A0ABU8XQN3_9PROT
MNEATTAARSEPEPLPTPPEARVRRRRGISLVWIIPLVAALVAGFLAWQSWMSQGPTVTITFETAEGLEAGKTKVKYRDVDVGTVETVSIGPDLQHITVTASMVPGAAPYLRTGTRFWIVRPRIGVGGVSGLGTLLSGAYIEVEPGDGDPARQFTGLEEPPPIRSSVPGRRFVLTADTLGSVSRGAPVTYRGVEVGQVLGYELAQEHGIDVTVFIRAPYDDLVRTNTRFWNASGFSLTTNSQGVSLDVASLQSLLIGGIEFETPPAAVPTAVAEAGTRFQLFASQSAASQAAFTEKVPFLVYFDGSVRGLHPGASVEFRGLKLGQVTEVRLEYDEATQRIRIPVLLELEPQRLAEYGTTILPEPENFGLMSRLVQQGLRAQLATGNILTGELFVDLVFVPDAPPAGLDTSGTVPVIPSVPNTLEALQASLTQILNKLASLPLDQLVASLTSTAKRLEQVVDSPDVKQAMQSLSASMAQLKETIARIDREGGPVLASLKASADAAAATLRQAETTMSSLQRTLGPNSVFTNNVEDAMQELTRAARSIRVFSDYLERHPEALIRGKAGTAAR